MVPKGAILMGNVIEGSPDTKPATKANLDNWITAQKTPNTWMLDSVAPQQRMAGHGGGTVGETFFNVGRDYFVIFDPRTMRIVDQGFGGNAPGALAALDTLCNQ